MTVVGVRHDTFDDNKTGKTIEFCHIYVSYEKKGVVGRAVEVLKVSGVCIPAAADLQPGDEINCYYDKYGKVGAIEELPPVKSA